MAARQHAVALADGTVPPTAVRHVAFAPPPRVLARASGRSSPCDLPRQPGWRSLPGRPAGLPSPCRATAASPASDATDEPSTSGRFNDSGRSFGPSGDFVVVLVEPKRGENIGAAARGMKNFGLRELRLVRPAGGEWPNEKARAVAARAVDVIDAAKVYDSMDAALADLQYVYATSGRPRAQDKLAKDVVLLRGVQDALPPPGTRIGIMFGREDNGLYNEELVRANAILTIDTDPGFYSLNLGQAVLIVCYELFRAPRRPELGAKRERASRREVEGMLGRLFSALEARSFFTQFNRDVLQFAIRGFFDRLDPLSRQDVAAVRQVLKALQRTPQPRAPSNPGGQAAGAPVGGDAAPQGTGAGAGAGEGTGSGRTHAR